MMLQKLPKQLLYLSARSGKNTQPGGRRRHISGAPTVEKSTATSDELVGKSNIRGSSRVSLRSAIAPGAISCKSSENEKRGAARGVMHPPASAATTTVLTRIWSCDPSWEEQPLSECAEKATACIRSNG